MKAAILDRLVETEEYGLVCEQDGIRLFARR